MDAMHDAMLNAEVESALQCLLESYELAAIYGDESLMDSAPYLGHMETLCQIKNDAMRSDRALACAKEQRTVEDFHRVYAEERQRDDKKFHPKKTNEYKSFQTRITQITDAAGGIQQASTDVTSTTRMECEEFVMESEINVYDPLTKVRMTDPVRNTLCGHHYEKSTIMESIQINPRLRCPVAGCANNQFIKMQHLQPDNALKVRLQQMAEAESQDPLAD